ALMNARQCRWKQAYPSRLLVSMWCRHASDINGPVVMAILLISGALEALRDLPVASQSLDRALSDDWRRGPRHDSLDPKLFRTNKGHPCASGSDDAISRSIHLFWHQCNLG